MKNAEHIKYLPFYALSVLPMKILYLFSDICYGFIYHVFGYRRWVVRENLMNAFPFKSEKEIIEIEKNFYRHFCDIAVESIKTLTIGKEAAKSRLKVRNPELLIAYLNAQKRILLYAAHQGNWEWLVYLPLCLNYPSYTFYRPLQNGYFNGLLLIIRERFGVHCVESKKGYKTIMEQENQRIPSMNCLIGDQSPRHGEFKKWCGFMGRDTAFFTGMEKIAQRTNSEVLFPKFTKIKRGYYELEFQYIEQNRGKNNVSSIVKNYARLLEESIVESPSLWLWSHRRWKLERFPAGLSVSKSVISERTENVQGVQVEA